MPKRDGKGGDGAAGRWPASSGAQRGPSEQGRPRQGSQPRQRPLREGEGNTALVNETFLLFTITFILVSRQLQYL